MATTSTKKSNKSNVAKGNLKKGSKFDVRIIALLAIILVAVVGYLFVRLSRAGSAEIYDGKNLDIAHGVAAPQANGETYVLSKPLDAQSAPNQPALYGLEVMEVLAYNSNASAVTACASGTAPAGAKVSDLFHSTRDNTTGDGSTLTVNALAQGAFNICRSFKAETMVSGNFRQFGIRFEAPVGSKVTLKRITVTSATATVTPTPTATAKPATPTPTPTPKPVTSTTPYVNPSGTTVPEPSVSVPVQPAPAASS